MPGVQKLQGSSKPCRAMQGFAGVDYSTKDRSSGPVQFERDPAEAVEADPFGLDQIISEVSCHPCLTMQGSTSRHAVV